MSERELPPAVSRELPPAVSRELRASWRQQSPPTRYYCPYCDTKPDGYAYPRGARHHMELKHPVKYAELMAIWGDENRINTFIKNAFIKTAYDMQTAAAAAAHTQTAPAGAAHTPPVEKSASGAERIEPDGADFEAEAGPGMAPGGETNLGVETPLKPNPGDFDLVTDVAAILETQELMREALNQAIEQLNVHSQSLSEIMGGTPAKTQLAPVAATGWSFDWKSIPKEWNDPIWKFMGDVGAALRTLAGGAPADDDYGKLIGNELKRREKERMASRTKMIVDTIYGDEELYSKPKDPPKPEDVKKIG